MPRMPTQPTQYSEIRNIDLDLVFPAQIARVLSEVGTPQSPLSKMALFPRNDAVFAPINTCLAMGRLGRYRHKICLTKKRVRRWVYRNAGDRGPGFRFEII